MKRLLHYFLPLCIANILGFAELHMVNEFKKN